jgi:NAD(P)-dependent dehydrogenase (short-subunit alcohol dehydrogenase family)
MSHVVAITGASAGIGRATAVRLARDGASVAICARRRDRLDEAGAEIEKAGGRALPVVADVTREAEMDAFVRRTVDEFGRLDVMMCNAGFGIYGAIDEITPEQMHKLMDVNYFGTYYAARAALRVFRRQQRGHLIITSSIAGKRGVPYMGAYSATKFAQIGMAECLRSELHGTDIHVSVLCPISTPSEFMEVLERESGGDISRSLGPKQPMEEVVEVITRAIEKPIPEIYPYKKARVLIVLSALWPGFADKMVQKFGRKPRRV